MSGRASFDSYSAWLPAPADRCTPLAEDARCNVVVVGGGYTGLSAALSLRRAGADVTVLEKDFAGAGSSGRNAGHVTPTIGKDLPTLLRLFGEARAAKIVRFADEAVEYAVALIDEHDIDCAYVAGGNVMAAVHPKQADRLRAAAELGRSLGADVAFDRMGTLGWSGREGIYTAHEALESYRLTSRNTLVGGSKVVRYEYGSRLGDGTDPSAFAAITRAFRERFPELADVEVRVFWGGFIGMTLDFLPTIGTTGDHGRIHHGYGYCGHGLAQACLMGDMLAHRARGQRHPAEAALDRSFWNLPPEPLRWLAITAIDGGLAMVDARTDRQVRRLSRSPAR